MKPTPASMLALALLAASASPGARAQSRGELLYGTHCIACHSTQMHWRDKRLATDWASLKAQVRRWQGVAQLGWSEEDILEVARHLNERIYRYPQTGDKLTTAPLPSRTGHRAFTSASLQPASMPGIAGDADAGTAPAHLAPVGPGCARAGATEVTSPAS
ncbi:hypothetical protein [uncultured Piscinibacter sp.]|uniref:hypothetical protein n=1 Tax=uncultured Piscinibacter sp. TaxID=1131835 RepID=UPI00261BCE32|nr:hypothetical protein [uncultured Piscinibacter sp.]